VHTSSPQSKAARFYGKALRQLLTDGLGGIDVYIVKPELKVCEDALVSAAITCFAPGANRSKLTRPLKPFTRNIGI
jgi:hypothetical protein